jgi:hypothetical protein
MVQAFDSAKCCPVEHAIALAGVTGTWPDVFAVQFTDRWFSIAPAPNAHGTV